MNRLQSGGGNTVFIARRADNPAIRSGQKVHFVGCGLCVEEREPFALQIRQAPAEAVRVREDALRGRLEGDEDARLLEDVPTPCIRNSSLRSCPIPARPRWNHLTRMSFLTELTPLTARVTATAVSISARVPTKPLS